MADHPSSQYIPILYKRYAKAWQRLRRESPFVEKAWLDRFIGQLPQVDSPQILDLGCGDGEPMAGYLIEQGAEITGVDITKRFIKSAKKLYKNITDYGSKRIIQRNKTH